MGATPAADTFVKMLEADTAWLFRLLRQCARVRVLFLAGAVSKREYMFEFLRRVAPSLGYRLEPTGFASSETRRQSPRFLRLQGPGLDLPAFFLSNSPSSRTAGAMRDAFETAAVALCDSGFTAEIEGTP